MSGLPGWRGWQQRREREACEAGEEHAWRGAHSMHTQGFAALRRCPTGQATSACSAAATGSGTAPGGEPALGKSPESERARVRRLASGDAGSIAAPTGLGWVGALLQGDVGRCTSSCALPSAQRTASQSPPRFAPSRGQRGCRMRHHATSTSVAAGIGARGTSDSGTCPPSRPPTRAPSATSTVCSAPAAECSGSPTCWPPSPPTRRPQECGTVLAILHEARRGARARALSPAAPRARLSLRD